jgi:hypothetical protein
VADTVFVTAEMQGGWTLVFGSSSVNEQGLQEMVRGFKATMYLGGKDPEVKPERPFAEDVDGGIQVVKNSGESVPKHEANWIEAMRGNEPVNCPLSLAIRAQALISLAEISEMTSKTVLFDPARRSWKFA